MVSISATEMHDYHLKYVLITLNLTFIEILVNKDTINDLRRHDIEKFTFFPTQGMQGKHLLQEQ